MQIKLLTPLFTLHLAFREVWVSTDHEGIAVEAEAAGATVHWRSPETAADNASTLSVVQDFLKAHSGEQ